MAMHRYQVGEQIGAVQQARLCRYDTLDGRSIPVSFIGASGLIALQQGFPGSECQHSKEPFQLSVASCEKAPGYAAKLDVVDP